MPFLVESRLLESVADTLRNIGEGGGRQNFQHVCQRDLSYANLSEHGSLDEMNEESRVVPFD